MDPKIKFTINLEEESSVKLDLSAEDKAVVDVAEKTKFESSEADFNISEITTSELISTDLSKEDPTEPNEVTAGFVKVPLNVVEELLFAQNIPEKSSEPSEGKITGTGKEYVKGNFLGPDQTDAIITKIEGTPISDKMDENGVVTIMKGDNTGILTLFTEDTNGNLRGDFVYTLTSDHLENNFEENFQYTLQNSFGVSMQYTLHINVIDDVPTIGQPEIATIDEEGLLPGTDEPTTFSGLLDVSFGAAEVGTIQFNPLVSQETLLGLNLTSLGEKLYYDLSENNTLLIATRGAHGQEVFTVKLNPDGTYDFTLSAPLDRAPAPNLLNNDNLHVVTISDETTMDILEDVPGWQRKKIYDDQSLLTQEIQTEPGTPYQLSLYYSPHTDVNHDPQNVDIYWNGKYVHTLSGSPQQWTGFALSLFGNETGNSTLEFVGLNTSSDLGNYLDNITLESVAQHKLPVNLGFTVSDFENRTAEGDITINVTTEPPIELTSYEPFNIVLEQAAYQTIIVNEQNETESTPLTTLNLNSLFDNLSIPPEERVVEVVQRHDGEQATNVYEVKIKDTNQIYDPITVADIQLTFPGGEDGLEIFEQTIEIQEI